MYLFFENATPRMNDVVFKMKIELMRRTPYDLRVRRTFFQERGGSKLYAEFRIRGGPRNRPIAYTGGELYYEFNLHTLFYLHTIWNTHFQNRFCQNTIDASMIKIFYLYHDLMLIIQHGIFFRRKSSVPYECRKENNAYRCIIWLSKVSRMKV